MSSARDADTSTAPVRMPASPGAAGRELTVLARLGAPVVLAQMAQMGMGVIDTIMAGRVSPEDVAGVALGGNVIWPTMILLMGVLMALTPTISRLHGAGRTAETGEVVRQGLWLALLCSALMVMLVSQAGALYRFMGVDAAIIPHAEAFVQVAAFGLPGIMFFNVFRYLCDGLGNTRPAMLVAFSALALKGFLNWILVYGNLGAPALGGLGCAWSTAIVMWFECGAMLLVVSRRRYRRRTGLFDRFSAPDPQRLLSLARLGVPIGLTAFFEIAAFATLTLLVSRLGANAVAAQQIAFSINGVAFMIPLGLGMAASIRVGHELGSGRHAEARLAAWVALGASLAYAVLAGVGLIFGRELLASGFTNDPTVATLASQLLLFVALYQLVDDAQATAIGGLRGYKDTRMPMFIALFGYWGLGLPLGAALGLGWLGTEPGVFGFWIGLASGLTVVAFAVVWRLQRISRNPWAYPHTLAQER